MFAFVLNREEKKAFNRAKKESVIRANKKKSNLNGNKNKSIENLNHLN